MFKSKNKLQLQQRQCAVYLSSEMQTKWKSEIVYNGLTDLIFVTNITNYICGEKTCHVEKLQISINKVFNLWDFVVIYAVFVLNLCGEKLSPKVHVWRKNDKYEVWGWGIIWANLNVFFLLFGCLT